MPCTSLIHWGSSKEACIFQDSSWMLSTSGIISSLHHHLGVSTIHPLHSTHFSCSSAGDSVGEWLPGSSSHLPAGLWKNCSTSGPSSSGGPRSNSASSSSHHGGLCAGELARLLSVRALWCLLLCPWDLLLCWSQLQEGAWASGWSLVMDQLSCSIFSSKVMEVARALQWDSLTLASWVSAEVPPLSVSHWMGGLSCPSFHLRQFFKEDTMSLANLPAHSSPHSGDLGNLLSL